MRGFTPPVTRGSPAQMFRSAQPLLSSELTAGIAVR
jgi:hypothetical protein